MGRYVKRKGRVVDGPSGLSVLGTALMTGLSWGAGRLFNDAIYPEWLARALVIICTIGLVAICGWWLFSRFRREAPGPRPDVQVSLKPSFGNGLRAVFEVKNLGPGSVLIHSRNLTAVGLFSGSRHVQERNVIPEGGSISAIENVHFHNGDARLTLLLNLESVETGEKFTSESRFVVQRSDTNKSLFPILCDQRSEHEVTPERDHATILAKLADSSGTMMFVWKRAEIENLKFSYASDRRRFNVSSEKQRVIFEIDIGAEVRVIDAPFNLQDIETNGLVICFAWTDDPFHIHVAINDKVFEDYSTHYLIARQ